MPELQRLVMPGASLGGARPKSLIHIDGDPWLVKFSEGEDFDIPWSCMPPWIWPGCAVLMWRRPARCR